MSNTTVSEFFERRETGLGSAKVAVKPMTGVQARAAYPYRPHSKWAESRYGGDATFDDLTLLAQGEARRCRMCQAPTRPQYLEDGVCRDCTGRSELDGVDPHKPR